MPRLQFILLFAASCTCVALAQSSQAPTSTPHTGRVKDWSTRHIVVSGGVTADQLRRGEVDPRVLFRLAERGRDSESWPQDPGGSAGSALTKKIDGSGTQKRRNIKLDWSVSLGNGTVAPYQFPAKFDFNTSGNPSCVNDFVVYGLNVAGVNGGQANVVGINNLYSGTGGICGANPTVRWAYNGSSNAGSVLTSPVISLDGKKIAYVESAAGRSVFHVLTWKAGDGTVTAAAAPVLNGACGAATSCLKSVAYSTSATTTFASPWVDYQTDKAFVASDNGVISRISCVFNCPLNTNPIVDWSFTLPVAGTGGTTPRPNGPVYNFPYGLLMVGDQLGEMWVLQANGAAASLFAGPVMIGGGGCTVTNPPGRTGTPAPCTATGAAFGIPDPVILDASSQSEKIFVFSGNDGTAGASAVVAQMNQDLTGLVKAHIGAGTIDVHTGAFDDPYWGNSPNTGELFVCGTGPADFTPTHYWIGFASYPTMDSTPVGHLQRLATPNIPCAPYTEFFNQSLNLGNVPGHHDLLVSGLVAAGANGYIITNDISTGAITASLNFVNYPGGVSGIVVDNDSPQAQASSVYFSTLQRVNVGTCVNQRCAVKLSQVGLK